MKTLLVAAALAVAGFWWWNGRAPKPAEVKSAANAAERYGQNLADAAAKAKVSADAMSAAAKQKAEGALDAAR